MTDTSRQAFAFVLSNEIVEVHAPDDQDLYDKARAEADEEFIRVKGNLEWVGMVYLANHLLNELADDLDISANEDPGMEGLSEIWPVNQLEPADPRRLAARVSRLDPETQADAIDDVRRALLGID